MLPCHDALVLCMLLADHTVCWQPLDHHTRNWDLIIPVIFAGYCFSKYQTYYICVDSSLKFCCAADLGRNSALCQGRIGHCFATGLAATDDQVPKALHASSKPEKKHHWTYWDLVMVSVASQAGPNSRYTIGQMQRIKQPLLSYTVRYCKHHQLLLKSRAKTLNPIESDSHSSPVH